MESRLRLVTQSGSVNDLYSLIQAEPNILENVDSLPFINTPLHEVSAAGKTDMAMELMILKPSFARKLNADGLSPLHLAVENQNAELALELVNFDPSLVRFPGRGGMTPLHLVAKKGDVDLLTEFLQACPESIKDVNLNGKTALHILVINDRYKELKVLTGWLQKRRTPNALSIEIYVLNKRDRQGNTALHLAAYENNHAVVKQLLKCMSLNRNIQNKNEMTALDVLRANGHMKKNTERLIIKSGGKTWESLRSKVKTKSVSLGRSVTFWGYCSTRVARFRSNVSNEIRNSLLVITALIITATYQTAVQAEGDKEDKGILGLFCDIVLLWGFNTTAFVLSIVFTFILLPAGRAYTWWYLVIMVPLICSFGLAAYMKYSDYDIEGLFITMYVIVALGILVYVLALYIRWKRTKPKKSWLKAEQICEEFKTVV